MIKYNKAQLARIAREYKLKFVILHGSYATERSHKGSDLDIAILANQELDFDKYLGLCSKLDNLFLGRELDCKTLHKVDSLFRYEVVRDGVLLYGNPTDYEEFKAFTYRAYEDARPLRELEEIMSRKHQKHLNTIAAKI